MRAWPQTVHRADLDGMVLRFEANGPAPIDRIVIDTIGDGEPAWSFKLDAIGPLGQSDGHGFRLFGVKPVVEGHWGLIVRAVDVRGCFGESAPGPSVDVVR